MKVKNLILLLSLIFSPKFYSQEDFKITYSRFFQDRLEPNWVKLEFEIVNKSNDTLYLNSEKINYRVLKKGNELKPEKIDYGIGQPFVRPRKEQCSEEKKIRNSLANKFVENLKKQNKSETLEFASNYIVVFPGEIVFNTELFQSRQFDKSCEVEVWYDSKGK